MKNHKWIIPFCLVLTVAFVLGVTGVVSLNNESGTTRGDKLVGFLVTRESLNLFDSDRYFDENIGKIVARGGGEITEQDLLKYGGRLWSSLTQKVHPGTDESGAMTELDYRFESVNGILIMYPDMPDTGEGSYGCTIADDEISETNLDISVTDNSEHITLEGTIFFVPRKSEEFFFFNPVHQTADGRIYAQEGTPVMVGREALGTRRTFSSSDSHTQTENGKTRTASLEIRVSVEAVEEPVRISLLQFSFSHELLKSDSFLPGSVPDEITPLTDTEYIIVDTEVKSAAGTTNHTRDVFGKDRDTLSTVTCLEDGICRKLRHSIRWPGASDI